jgi:hypothetical protein
MAKATDGPEHRERAPECGRDFCDQCGDCLACYASDPCHESSDGVHTWQCEPGVFVSFGTEQVAEDFVRMHPDADQIIDSMMRGSWRRADG